VNVPASRPVDLLALERARRRLVARAQVPWLHDEVARRMGERLAVVRVNPEAVIDWGGSVGGGAGVLARAYPLARRSCVGPGSAGAALEAVRPRWTLFARRPAEPAVRWVAEGDVAVGEADLVWSNMTLHGEPDPRVLMRRWHRAVRAGGFLMFSTFGPGTLPELRELYAQRGWGPPGDTLVDMHDLGDMLVEAGFADPVMDQETIHLTWADARSALSELRGLGANVHPARHRGLRTPGWRERLFEALAQRAHQAAEGRVRLSFEVVYGHAFRVAAPPRLAPVTKVELSEMRDMVRRARR
jgi:malonyl-CoA O-methyltransferase